MTTNEVEVEDEHDDKHNGTSICVWCELYAKFIHFDHLNIHYNQIYVAHKQRFTSTTNQPVCDMRFFFSCIVFGSELRRVVKHIYYDDASHQRE